MTSVTPGWKKSVVWQVDSENVFLEAPGHHSTFGAAIGTFGVQDQRPGAGHCPTMTRVQAVSPEQAGVIAGQGRRRHISMCIKLCRFVAAVFRRAVGRP